MSMSHECSEVSYVMKSGIGGIWSCSGACNCAMVLWSIGSCGCCCVPWLVVSWVMMSVMDVVSVSGVLTVRSVVSVDSSYSLLMCPKSVNDSANVSYFSRS